MKIFTLALLLSATTVFAQDLHFFGSFDYAKTTTKNDVDYLSIKNSWSSSYLSTAGLNASAQIDEKSKASVQVIHSAEANKIVADLIQYQRNFNQDVIARVGKQRLPIFLKSEVIQVKALYPWAIAPVEVYNQVPVRSFTGASLEKSMGPFSVQLYAGSSREEIQTDERMTKINGDQLIGSRLNFRHDGFEAYANFLKDEVRVSLQTEVQISTGVTGQSKIKEQLKDLEIYTIGLKWELSRWLIMSEYIDLRSRGDLVKKTESAYLSTGYNITEKLLALGTISSDLARESNFTPSMSTTYNLTLNYAIDQNTVIKLGGSQVSYRRRNKPSDLSTTGFVSAANGFSEDPGNNFQIYDLQLAFVY